VRHYRERFTGVVERTVGGVNKLSNQIVSWLRRDGDDEEDDEAGEADGAGEPDDADDAGEASDADQAGEER
jgi:hypothetical protein